MGKPGLEVLIAEDEVIARRSLQIAITRAGYDVVTATSGTEALERIAQHPNLRLILADIVMPGMDGLELLTEVKAHPRWQHIPVVLCTVLDETDAVRRARRLGCHHYLVKPVSEKQLMVTVTSALGLEDLEPIPDIAMREPTHTETPVLEALAQATLEEQVSTIVERLAVADEPEWRTALREIVAELGAPPERRGPVLAHANVADYLLRVRALDEVPALDA